MYKSLSFGRGFITFVYFIAAPFHGDWNSTNTTEQIRGINNSFVENEMIRSQCTALFFEHDRSRYDTEIFPITRQYYSNDVIYAQYPISICIWIWIAQRLEPKASINFFTTNRCEAFTKIDFFSIFPLFSNHSTQCGRRVLEYSILCFLVSAKIQRFDRVTY